VGVVASMKRVLCFCGAISARRLAICLAALQVMVSASAQAEESTPAAPLDRGVTESAVDDDATAAASASHPWGPVPTTSISLANVSPMLLRYVNNGAIFGLPGTVLGDISERTELTGDWGGLRTELARDGVFIDAYGTLAYHDVASGGIETGGS